MLRTADGVRLDKGESNLVYHDQDVFEANEVTLRILEICRQPRSRTQITQILSGEYEISGEELARDVLELIPQLIEDRLLEEIR